MSDAGLAVHETQSEPVHAQRAERVRRLLHPDNVVIVGASDRPTSWASRIHQNLTRFGYAGRLLAINPKHSSLWGEPCFPDLASLPVAPDHLVVLTPSREIPGILEEGAARGARSATIFGAVDGEGPGTDLARLADVIARTGITVSGPNCLGNICGASRLVTVTDRRLRSVADGPVAVVARSGGIALTINRRLDERGVDVGYLITTGNELDLSVADFVEYFVQVGGVRVIALFLEGLRDAPRFLDAVSSARDAGIPVVALKVGASEKSRAAALSHTGAITGSTEAFDAVAGRSGVVRVDTLEELIELADCLSTLRPPKGRGIAAATFSGGAIGLLEDSASRRSIDFAALSSETSAALHRALDIHEPAGNPLDTGYRGLTDVPGYLEGVSAILRDPAVDLLLVQGDLPADESGFIAGVHGETSVRELDVRAEAAGVPILMFSMGPANTTEYSRTLRRAMRSLAFVHGLDAAVAVARRLGDVGEIARRQPSAGPTPTDGERRSRARQLLATRLGGGPLDELASKTLLGQYGLRAPTEMLAPTADEAVSAASAIGFPVVLKLVADRLQHKTELGAVILALETESDVAAAASALLSKATTTDVGNVRGLLVSRYVAGGIEAALGIHVDPEVGPVLMVGLGGIWLETLRDWAFAAVPTTTQEAERALSRTRLGEILAGTRGAPPYDREAVIEAMVGLAQFAADCVGLVAAVDVNPLICLPRGEGAWAVDALVVPAAAQAAPQ